MENEIINILTSLEIQNLLIQALQKSPESKLDKRALSIAITNLETSMLWLTNSLPV